MNIQKNKPHGIDICSNYKNGLIIHINVLISQFDLILMSNTLYPIENIRVAPSVPNLNTKLVWGALFFQLKYNQRVVAH
jgi:hypothetical protein